MPTLWKRDQRRAAHRKPLDRAKDGSREAKCEQTTCAGKEAKRETQKGRDEMKYDKRINPPSIKELKRRIPALMGEGYHHASGLPTQAGADAGLLLEIVEQQQELLSRWAEWARAHGHTNGIFDDTKEALNK